MKRRVTTRGEATKGLRRKAAKSGSAPSTTRRRGSADVGRQERLDEAKRELREAREQQAATSEVLRVIANSAGDLQPVFDAVVANATRICEAKFGALFLAEGSKFRTAAMHNLPPSQAEARRREPVVDFPPDTVSARAMAAKQVIQIENMAMEPGYIARHPRYVSLVELGGARSVLFAPLIKDGRSTGIIIIFRQEIRPFTDRHIELVTHFAAQAVIAIENARLLNELRQRTDDLGEALEQQTATSEVLQVISRASGDLDPVFQSMLRNAARICEAPFGNLLLLKDGVITIGSQHGTPAGLVELLKRGIRPGPLNALGRVIATRSLLHIADYSADRAYLEREQVAVWGVEIGGIRSLLIVPMLKEDELIGAFGLYRQEVRPFTDKQIELVRNFAAQAVIAIENARLLNELRQRTSDLSESLEQQTAASEVLQVISSSPGDLQPVFDSILTNATRICTASFGNLMLYEAGILRRVALHNAPPAWAEDVQRHPVLRPTAIPYRVAQTGQVVHIPDLATEYPNEVITRLAGARTLLIVPMLKESEVKGAIGIYRQEVQPFTDKQIELVQNFAAQAVIAIENTRLLNELRQRTDDLSETLEQQTATSEVLKVISSSPDELEQVFRAVLENSVCLCAARFGAMFKYDNGGLDVTATYGVPAAYQDHLRDRGTIRPRVGTVLERVISTKEAVHVADVTKAEGLWSPAGQYGGARTFLGVPMIKDGSVIGTLAIYRQEVLPFTDKQIEVVANFANQAVIAIENARLLNELRESLEQQTATSEVLQVVSRSPGDLEPVFQAMLANATRICGASFGNMLLYENGLLRRVALHNTPARYTEFNQKRPLLDPEKVPSLGRLVQTRRAVQVPDLAVTEPDSPLLHFGGARTLLVVPMLKDDSLIGGIGIYRKEVSPFTEKQIELVQNFAAQAVIAIENARLLNELRQSLEQQTATADVLKTISRSSFDLQTVLDALVESSGRLCHAERATIRLLRDGFYHNVADYGFTTEHRERMRREPVAAGPGSMVGRIAQERKPVHLVDSQADSEPELARRSKSGGVHSMLGVPLLREGSPIGVMLLQRTVVQPFTEKQIDLATTFADQAVIAIENARLLSELRETLQQQTATADVLKVISRSTFDLKTVLNTLVESAARLCDADMGAIARPKYENYNFEASYGTSREFDDFIAAHPAGINRGTAIGRSLVEGKVAHIPDVMADPDYTYREGQKLGGFRTMLAVPLLREGTPVGVLALGRLAIQPFNEKQIDLVQTFADQAAIAIENVRLFDEIRETSRQLAEASRHKSQFLANMSHELRTPLNAILGYTELILDGIYGETPEKAQDVLKRVESNGKHLLGLINDVLDFSKIEAGQLKLAISEFLIKDVVYNVYSAVEPLATKKNLKFMVEVPPALPPGQGDERKLTQVLLNLVGNAIKFTDAGEVAIKVASANGSLSVAVYDTGPGIPKADQEKMFEEFQQADNSITKAKGGTGLGLAISRRIIELHGGRLWVESSPGKGSVFTFEIPSTVAQSGSS
jgi:GAF domain-containing protein